MPIAIEKVKVRKGGDVTIPTPLREAFGLRPDSEVTLVRLKEGILLVPINRTLARYVEENEKLLAEEGLRLEDLLAGLRRERERYVKAVYGPKA